MTNNKYLVLPTTVHWYRHNHRNLPMVGRGEDTIKQPVYVTDFCKGIVNAVKNPTTMGKTYDVVGPRRYFLSDLVDWMHYKMRKDPILWGYRRGGFSGFTRWKCTMNSILELPFSKTVFHWERVEREIGTD